MNGEQPFSARILIGWAAAAVVVFAISLYFMGGGQLGNPMSIGPSTFSRSAIGYAGIAEVLHRLDIPVVKSRNNSLDKATRGSVMVIAEPSPGGQTEEIIRRLLNADTILIVLPKWTGQQDEQKPEWLAKITARDSAAALWVLRLIEPSASVLRESNPVSWTTNQLSLTPDLIEPLQLMRSDRLTPIIAGDKGILLGELASRNRRIWVLSDPDIMSNHGLAHAPNAQLAAAIFERLRGPDGVIVFDETIHGFFAGAANPFLLMFRFPFVIATVQAAIAVALLLWASMARFGAPQSAPPSLQIGRQGLLQNVAGLIEFTGHQPIMIRRYIQETIRDVAHQLHAPRGLSGGQLIAWLQRVGAARGVDVDCAAVAQQASELTDARGRDMSRLVRLARDIHRWKQEIVDGPSRNSRPR